MTTTARSPSTTAARDVGVIGLGTMGRPMAGHLLRGLGAGATVHLTGRTPASADALVAQGARWHTTARSLGAVCDMVIFMVPDLPEVRAILDGPDGLLAEVTSPTVIVIGSTVSSAGVRELDSELRGRTGGLVHLVDAPVSGGEEGAIAGTMSIMVGGADEDVARAMTVLRTMGLPVHLGPLGAGETAKACNQMIVAATVLALGEAAVVAERAGLDVQALFDLLQQGFAGSRIMEVKKHRFATHDHSPSAAARFLAKDLAFAATEARRTGTTTPQLDVLLATFADLTSRGFGDQDIAVVQAYLETRSPVPDA